MGQEVLRSFGKYSELVLLNEIGFGESQLPPSQLVGIFFPVNLLFIWVDQIVRLQSHNMAGFFFDNNFLTIMCVTLKNITFVCLSHPSVFDDHDITGLSHVDWRAVIIWGS